MIKALTVPAQSKLNYLLTALIVVVLLLPLVAIPGPSMTTGHPWKVEFVLSLAVFAIFVWICAKSNTSQIVHLYSARYPRYVLASLSVFVVWSGISAIWANAYFSVIHHTSVWFLYASIFVLTLRYFNRARSIHFVIVTFGALSLVLLVICLIDFLSFTKFDFVPGRHRMRYAKYGELLAMIAPLILSAAFYKNRKAARTGLVLMSLGAWLVVMLSLSKGAFLAGIIGFVFLFAGSFLFSKRTTRKTVLATALCWIALTLGFQVFFSFFSSVPATTQYITGKTEPNRETSNFRVFTWKVGATMALSNPIVGVGADNFGTSFNKARQEYFAKSDDKSPGLSVAEDHMVERAHNEFLQIFSELGTIGILLFGLIMLSFVVSLIAHFKRRKRLSPILIGALAGMTSFAASSMVSSFSFRAVQNGVVFIVIFAIGLYEINKHDSGFRKLEGHQDPNPMTTRLLWLLPIVTLLFVFFHAIVGISNFYTLFGQSEKDPIRSRAYFDTALKLNAENGAAYFMSGTRAYSEQAPDQALPRLEKSRMYGATATLNYYATAESHLLNNDLKKATETLSEAVAIYPKSVYARVHYSLLLERSGHKQDANREYAEAFRLNARQAETWKFIIKDGLLNATDATRNREDLDKPIELDPQNIVKFIFHKSRIPKATE